MMSNVSLNYEGRLVVSQQVGGYAPLVGFGFAVVAILVTLFAADWRLSPAPWLFGQQHCRCDGAEVCPHPRPGPVRVCVPHHIRWGIERPAIGEYPHGGPFNVTRSPHISEHI